MTAVRSANLFARFLLELCALGALAYWGFHTGDGMISRLGPAIGAPLLVALIWGAFVSPKAAVRVPRPVHLLLQAVLFGASAAALAAAGHPWLGVALGLAAIANWALLQLWGQRVPVR